MVAHPRSDTVPSLVSEGRQGRGSGHPTNPHNGDRWERAITGADLVGPNGWVGGITPPDCEPVMVQAPGDYRLKTIRSHRAQELSLGTW